MGVVGKGEKRRLFIDNIEELWVEYDRQNDILYINFGVEEADESILIDDDIVVSISDGKLVGISIYSFSKKAGIQP